MLRPRISPIRDFGIQHVDDPAHLVASPDGVTALAEHYTQAVVSNHLQLEIAEVGRDRQSPLPGLDRSLVLARQPRSRAFQRKDACEPTPIVKHRSETLGRAKV